MKILADENVHADIIKGLCMAGCDALFVAEIGLAGNTDRKILEYTEQHDLILLSGDKDFGGLIEFGTLWGAKKQYHFFIVLTNVTQIVTIENEVLK